MPKDNNLPAMKSIAGLEEITPAELEKRMKSVHDQIQVMNEFVKTIMKDNEDYGVIPGTEKKTLFKPGAEKLAQLFKLIPEYEPLLEEVVLIGEHPHATFRYRCILRRQDMIVDGPNGEPVTVKGGKVGEGIGLCTSDESKYKWRQKERVCPTCNKESIIKGKEQFGGGWICWAKKGGCGAKFADDEPMITSQESGKVLNPDIADVFNTIDKMAQKRAFVAAVISATRLSNQFTQDLLEDEENKEEKEKSKENKQLTKALVTFWTDAEKKLGFKEAKVIELLNEGFPHTAKIKDKADLEKKLLNFDHPVEQLREYYAYLIEQAKAKAT